mmetsp:Transcript_102669/g.306637  ORF Transcript_102669/g.306637 Transcript_102669/m.306637 type:complete len:120 (-) Transcript_102669:166-525(-)
MAGELWKILLAVHTIPLGCLLLALPLCRLRRRPGVVGAMSDQLLIFPVGCGVMFFFYLMYFVVRFVFLKEDVFDYWHTEGIPLPELCVALGMFVAHQILDSLPPRASSGRRDEGRPKGD